MSIIVSIIVIVELLLIGTVTILLNRTARNNKMSFQETLYLTDLPIVTFYNNGRKFNFVLDTGANQSIINQNDLDSCAYEKLEETTKLMGLDGNSQQVQTLVSMNISHKNKEYVEKFQVSDLTPLLTAMKQAHGVSVHGIIGNTFFSRYEFVLDFDDMIAYTKSK